MRLGVSPAAAPTPTGSFDQRSEALFPGAGALGCEVCFFPPLILPFYICGNVGSGVYLVGSASHHLVGSASCSLACPSIRHLARSTSPCLARSPLRPLLPISAPPAGLDECFFFISLVVGLPYSLIFCQFGLFFVFKLLLSSFWLCGEVQCVYLCLHLGWNYFKFLKIY